jgi:hypothetical protein
VQYLKIWLSFAENLAPLTDDETGRLLRMMLHYAGTGEPPAAFKGNELFVWAAAKQMIDAAEAKVETLRQNGSKGGRPCKQMVANDSTEKQTKAKESKEKQTEADESLNVKDKDNVKEKDKDNRERFDRFWKAYPRKTAKETALRAFLKLSPDEGLLQIMLAAVEKQKQTAQWQEEGGRYIPHPATWLNQKRWQDEVRTAGAKKAAQDFEQRDYSGVQAEMMDELAADMKKFKSQEAG